MFFEQKTEYEMRIRYWSSDVCSSDLKDRDHVADIDLAQLGDRGKYLVMQRGDLRDRHDMRRARPSIFARRHGALGHYAVDGAVNRLFGQDALGADVFELRDALLLRGGAPFLGGGDGVGACLLDLVAGQMRANAFAALAHRPQIGGARLDRKSTRLNSSHSCASRMPSSA